MSNRTIYLTEFDVKRLKDLLAEAKHSEYRGSDYLIKLEQEIERGAVLPPEEIPPDVITMNSRVLLVDLDEGDEEEYTLVFPKDADLSQRRVSILAPVGTAMLGYRVGDIFEWPVPDGVRRLRVEKIIYQPEAAGDFDL